MGMAVVCMAVGSHVRPQMSPTCVLRCEIEGNQRRVSAGAEWPRCSGLLMLVLAWGRRAIPDGPGVGLVPRVPLFLCFGRPRDAEDICGSSTSDTAPPAPPVSISLSLSRENTPLFEVEVLPRPALNE